MLIKIFKKKPNNFKLKGIIVFGLKVQSDIKNIIYTFQAINTKIDKCISKNFKLLKKDCV